MYFRFVGSYSGIGKDKRKPGLKMKYRTMKY